MWIHYLYTAYADIPIRIYDLYMNISEHIIYTHGCVDTTMGLMRLPSWIISMIGRRITDTYVYACSWNFMNMNMGTSFYKYGSDLSIWVEWSRANVDTIIEVTLFLGIFSGLRRGRINFGFKVSAVIVIVCKKVSWSSIPLTSDLDLLGTSLTCR
jgi:hypothetical protein